MSAKAEPWALDDENDISFPMDGTCLAIHFGCRFVIDPTKNWFECIDCNDDKWRGVGNQYMKEAIEEHASAFHCSLNRLPLPRWDTISLYPGIFTSSLDGHLMYHYKEWRFLVNSVKNMVICLTCRESRRLVVGARSLLELLEAHIGETHLRVIYDAQVAQLFRTFKFQISVDYSLLPAKEKD